MKAHDNWEVAWVDDDQRHEEHVSKWFWEPGAWDYARWIDDVVVVVPKDGYVVIFWNHEKSYRFLSVTFFFGLYTPYFSSKSNASTSYL